MSKQIQAAVKVALTGVILTASAGMAVAGTVDSSMRTFNGGGTSIGAMGDSLVATGQTTSAHSYTDNAQLNYSAWGHAGRWFNFEVTSNVDTQIKVTADNTANWSPAFTVYSTAGVWGGGTATFTEVGITGNTPHNFNATGNIGDNGTLWMQQGAAGNNPAFSNAVATLGYANSGASHAAATTNWGEQVNSGVHAMAGELTFSSGMTGSIGAGTAELTFADLNTGWYTVYVGGADATKLNSPFSVRVSAVPVPAAAYLFGSGLIGLFAARRKALKTA
ncbi:MAG: hypothetical protein L3J75_04510 [Methylococcaceae bacterium]|nr:hypothetical protein [Methylococcaceae bacterium]